MEVKRQVAGTVHILGLCQVLRVCAEFCLTTQHQQGGGLTPPTHPLGPPPRKFFSGSSANQNFSLAPSAQVSLGQKISSAPSAPLTAQGLPGGVGGTQPHPPTPLGPPPLKGNSVCAYYCCNRTVCTVLLPSADTHDANMLKTPMFLPLPLRGHQSMYVCSFVHPMYLPTLQSAHTMCIPGKKRCVSRTPSGHLITLHPPGPSPQGPLGRPVSPSAPQEGLRRTVPKANKTIYLVRHGETEMNRWLGDNWAMWSPLTRAQKQVRDPGFYDTKLTPRGRQQALALARQVQSLEVLPEVIISSPLTRALQTTKFGFGSVHSEIPVEVHASVCARCAGTGTPTPHPFVIPPAPMGGPSLQGGRGAASH